MVCSISAQQVNDFLKSVLVFFNQCENQQLEIVNEMADFIEDLLNQANTHYQLLENTKILPVMQYLRVAVDAAGKTTADVAQNFYRTAPIFAWKQTQGYQVLGEHFMRNYAYCNLIGPQELIHHSTLKLGFCLWGPNMHYPLHHHAAEECYHVVGNSMQFRRHGEQWQMFADGQAIYNKSWAQHELKSLDYPMLLLFIWRGEVDRPSQLFRPC